MSALEKLQSVVNKVDKFQIESINVFKNIFDNILSINNNISTKMPIIEGDYTLTRTLSTDELSNLGSGIILVPAMQGYLTIVSGYTIVTSVGNAFDLAGNNLTIIQDLVPVDPSTATWYTGSAIATASTTTVALAGSTPSPVTTSTNIALYSDNGTGFQDPRSSATASITATITLTYSIIKLQ